MRSRDFLCRTGVAGVVAMEVLAYNAQGMVVKDQGEAITAVAIKLRICADRDLWSRSGRHPYCQLWPVLIVPRMQVL